MPTVAGNFTAVIQAVDADVFTDSITVTYTISAVVPLPDLGNAVNISYGSSNLTYGTPPVR